jgi:2-polyprenyl-6-hydroxyphenyl methylase/3-demethylubiquinone-9 3-methyltransferase
MRGVAGNPEHWEIREGSILDENFVRSIPLADVVYSWGVLHHTGDMWRAIRMAGDLVKPGGRFAIAIYNKLEYSTFKQWRGSHKWFRIKQTYNRSGTVTKRAMELAFASKDIITMLLRVRSPVACVREYREKRGMSWWHDLVDWLGGYPYEFASAGEIFMFCHEQLGMELERLSTTCSIGCHEFLFVRPAERPATPLSCGIPFDRQARLE